MRYWDSSALVPLLVDEHRSGTLRDLLREDDDIVTWSWARTEVVSALERRFREHKYSRAERRSVLADFDSFIHSWDEFSAMRDIQSRAHELLARHQLRAADAGHLAAALIYQERSNEPLDFVCLDNQLSEAAVREGFHVWPEPPSKQN